MNSEETKARIGKITAPRTYQNTKNVVLGGITFTIPEVVIAAPLISALNVYLVGGTGEGKSQLATDLVQIMGDSHCYAEGRPDFELREVMEQVNIDLKRIELTGNTGRALYYVDELNRCPPIVMNYFFNFFDGKLVYKGRILRLGNNGYSVGYASGNLGDGTYVGISDVDRALKDRMHLIIKLDHPRFSTREKDDFEIFTGGKKSPRPSFPQGGQDNLEDVLKLHEAWGQRQVPQLLGILGVYFHKSLDYLEKVPSHSKRAIDMQWPNHEKIRKDNDENKIFPLSKRAVLATMGLTGALRMIAEAKGNKDISDTKLFLDALQLTVPYSGILSPVFVNSYGGDVYAATDDVMEKIRSDIVEKEGDIVQALAFAQYGEKNIPLLDSICPAGHPSRWGAVRRVLEDIADETSDGCKTEFMALKGEYKKGDIQDGK